jgi:hypothetical protein
MRVILVGKLWKIVTLNLGLTLEFVCERRRSPYRLQTWGSWWVYASRPWSKPRGSECSHRDISHLGLLPSWEVGLLPDQKKSCYFNTCLQYKINFGIIHLKLWHLEWKLSIAIISGWNWAGDKTAYLVTE